MSLLPGQILPESVPFGRVDSRGQVFVDHNWYLLLYNLALQVLAGSGAGAGLPTSQADLIDMTDLDAAGTDVSSLAQAVSNLAQLMPEEGIFASLQQLANAMVLASDSLLQDPVSRAQPAQSVTVGASPFTYTAAADGVLFVSGGTVSAVAIVRQGTSVPAGITAGPIPMRRLDQVTVTYTAAPALNFLPA